MEGVIPKLRSDDKRRLLQVAQASWGASLKTRYLVSLNLDDGVNPTQIIKRLKIVRSTVYRMATALLSVVRQG